MEYFLIASSIICAILLAGYMIAFQDLKRISEIQAMKDEIEIDALKKELNFYKRYNKEIPYTTKSQRNIKS